jgi:hypothetical protein
VQIGHTTIVAWERDIADVVDAFNADTPLQKAMSGTLGCVAVAGAEWIERWKARIAAYPDGLQRAMVVRHLQFFPLWAMPYISGARDATIWQHQILVEGAFNLLAILAALNRQYFSTFQFKKMRRFLAPMTIVPARCAERLEDLFRLPPVEAAGAFETLVRDVVALIEQAWPDVDTEPVRRRLGYRRAAWQYVAGEP